MSVKKKLQETGGTIRRNCFKFDCCPDCLNNYGGPVSHSFRSKIVRNILCEFCLDGSNHKKMSNADFAVLEKYYKELQLEKERRDSGELVFNPS